MTDSPKSTRPTRQRPLRILVAVVAAVVIAFSGWSLYEYAQGSDPISWLLGQPALQTTQESQDNASGNEPSDVANGSSDEAGSEQANASDTGESTADHGSEPDASSSTKNDGSAGKGEGGSASHNGNTSAKANSSSSSSNASNGGSATNTGSPNGGSGSSSSSSAGSGQATAQPQQPAQPQTISVRVTIDGTPAGGSRHGGTVELSPGATAYDALVAADGNINARGSVYGTYVAAIDGLAEKQHGTASGWLYAVNGVRADTACSNYHLSNGDVVTWTYWVGDELPS